MHIQIQTELPHTHAQIVEGMRPFMLPTFFYGGQINRALEVPGVDSGQHVALTEIRALLVWLMLQLGIANKEQVGRRGRACG